MSTAVVYMSRHGTAQKVANMLKEKISKDVVLFDLRKNKAPDLNLYDCIIIGGSIHVGMIHKKIKHFCEINTQMLLEKRLGLFLCCMYEDKEARDQFNNAFSNDLREHSKAQALLGGEYIFEEMNFLEKLIVKKVSNFKETVSNIKMEELELFAQKMIAN